MKYLILNNTTIKLSDVDYEWALQYKWYLNNGYANRRMLSTEVGYNSNKQTMLFMQIEIFKRMYNLQCMPNGSVVDHKNRNRLDYTRDNLRLATSMQNNWNASKRKDGTSQYKGLTWFAAINKWSVTIQADHHKLHLGCFTSELIAARIYNIAARRYFGEFACLNEINESIPLITCKPNIKYILTASGYLGVFKTRTKMFGSRIRFNNRAIHLGTFNNPEEAARAYDIKYEELHPNKAHTHTNWGRGLLPPPPGRTPGVPINIPPLKDTIRKITLKPNTIFYDKYHGIAQ